MEEQIIEISRATEKTTKRVITAAVPGVKDKNGNMVREARPEVSVMDPVLVTQEEAFKRIEQDAKELGFQNFTMVDENENQFAFRLFNPIKKEVDEEKPTKKKKK